MSGTLPRMPLFYGIEVYRSHGAPQESASGMQHEPQLRLDAHTRTRVALHARENRNPGECFDYDPSLSLFPFHSTHLFKKLTMN